MPRTTKRVRRFVYEVDEVWGFEDRPTPPVTVGAVLIDRWKADRCWNVYDFTRKGDPHIGGWHAKLHGEFDGPIDEVGRPQNHDPQPEHCLACRVGAEVDARIFGGDAGARP